MSLVPFSLFFHLFSPQTWAQLRDLHSVNRAAAFKPIAECGWLLKGDSPCGCYITNHLKDNVSLTCLWIMCCSLVMQLLSNAVCVCACLGIPCETPITYLCCIFHICYLHSSFILYFFRRCIINCRDRWGMLDLINNKFTPKDSLIHSFYR